jgi:4-amino-4-deoxy-L-arabinose transferase-like glycosyltransferase
VKILSWNVESKLMVIIGLLFFVRLFHITYPPIEVAHNWRQTTSLMVARNYVQLDHNIMYPTIDECGDHRGVIGMEFPILPYSIYLISIPFGYEHWYGRLVVLFFSSIGIWYFYKLTKLFFDQRIAFFAALSFAFSALFHLSRKVMPDPLSLSLVIIGVYYGVCFLRFGKWQNALGYFVFATLGTLVKIPFGLFLVVLAFPFFDGKNLWKRKITFSVLSIVLLIAVYWWYFVWNVYLMETFGQWYNSGRSIGEGFKELSEHWKNMLEKFYFSAFHSYSFFVLTLAGLVMMIKDKVKPLLTLIVVLIPLFAVYMMKSGFLFTHHGYYALVIMPAMALLVGYLLSRLSVRWAAILISVAVIESVANQQHDFFIRKEAFVKLQLENVADQICTQHDLVALVSNENPNEFYFLNRKGWIIHPDKINTAELDHLRQMGCRYLFMKNVDAARSVSLDRVFENQDYVVFGM